MAKTLSKIIRNGFVYGVVFFALSFYLGFLFHMTMKDILLVSTPIALLALLINGITYSRFTKSEKALEAITLSSHNDVSEIKLQSPANYYIDDHIISGKLFLTDHNLIFKAYQNKGENEKVYSFALSDFYSFDFFPSLFNKGGEFITADNNEQKLVFEVDELKLWKKTLT